MKIESGSTSNSRISKLNESSLAHLENAKIIDIKRDKSKLIYFTNAEFEQLNKMLTQGEYQNMNDMIRGVLLNNQ